MSTVKLEIADGLATLTLDKGRGNAIDRPLIDDLRHELGVVEADPAVRGVLLASAHPTVFSPGLDLPTLIALQPRELEDLMLRFAHLVRELFTFPRPVVAAVSGHAVAGGCVLQLTADWKILRGDSVKVGLNELRVGVPLPWTVTSLINAVIPRQALAKVAAFGSNFSGQEALAVGLGDEIGPEEGFAVHCRSRLAELAERPTLAFATTKRNLRREASEAMAAREGELVRGFVDCWFSAESQERLQAAIAALKARG